MGYGHQGQSCLGLAIHRVCSPFLAHLLICGERSRNTNSAWFQTLCLQGGSAWPFDSLAGCWLAVQDRVGAATAAGCQGDSGSRQAGLREPYLNLPAAYSSWEASNQGDILFWSVKLSPCIFPHHYQRMQILRLERFWWNRPRSKFDTRGKPSNRLIALLTIVSQRESSGWIDLLITWGRHRSWDSTQFYAEVFLTKGA